MSLEILERNGVNKANLEVYVYIDLDKKRFDIDIILKCIKVFITVHNPEFNVRLFKEIDNAIIETNGEDIIQRGMYSFCKMYETLKLKTKDKVWFLYIASGYLKMIPDSDVTLLLLNKDPIVRECFYTLHKKAIEVFPNQAKSTKIKNLQVIKRSLDELFSTKKTIKYKLPSLQRKDR